MDARHTIGGRVFVSRQATTARQDDYVAAQLGATGLRHIARGEDESVDDYATRVLDSVLASNSIDLLLGGLLVPEGHPWSPEVALDTATFFANLTDPEQKAQRRALVLDTLIFFYANGISSSQRSQTSSDQETPTQPTTAATGRRGAGWFARLRASITRRRTASITVGR